MNAQVITTEYADQWPLQPWAAAVQTAAAAETAEAAAPTWAPSTGAESASPRKARDRGASAVEWVVITGIVVAIVGVVGTVIFNAVKGKADDTQKQITNVDPTGM